MIVTRPILLVTGLSGLIGGALRRHLGDRYELRALNRRAVEGVPTHRADIADLDAIVPAFAGAAAVVHLAACVGSGSPSFEPILQANVVGTRNVLEAAHRAGVPRVVFASSGAVVSGYEKDEPYRSLVTGRYDGPAGRPMLTRETPVRPVGLYGSSKVWGEALGRHYADAHGLSVLCVRIGRVNAEDRPLGPRDFSVWCSQRDVVRMLERCVEAPPALVYDIFFVTSRNRLGYRDLAHAREVLGFEPLDSADARR